MQHTLQRTRAETRTNKRRTAIAVSAALVFIAAFAFAGAAGGHAQGPATTSHVTALQSSWEVYGIEVLPPLQQSPDGLNPDAGYLVTSVTGEPNACDMGAAAQALNGGTGPFGAPYDNQAPANNWELGVTTNGQTVYYGDSTGWTGVCSTVSVHTGTYMAFYYNPNSWLPIVPPVPANWLPIVPPVP